LALTFTDLVYVANFKGGSATIAESVGTLTAKLSHYTNRLQLLPEAASPSTSDDAPGAGPGAFRHATAEAAVSCAKA